MKQTWSSWLFLNIEKKNLGKNLSSNCSTLPPCGGRYKKKVIEKLVTYFDVLLMTCLDLSLLISPRNIWDFTWQLGLDTLEVLLLTITFYMSLLTWHSWCFTLVGISLIPVGLYQNCSGQYRFFDKHTFGRFLTLFCLYDKLIEIFWVSISRHIFPDTPVLAQTQLLVARPVINDAIET